MTVMPDQAVAAASPLPSEAVQAAPAVSADVTIAAAVIDRDPTIEPVSSSAKAAPQPDATACAVQVPPVSAPDVACEPAVSPDIALSPARSPRTRPFALRWAAAAAILAVCLLGLARLSDTQVSAYAVPGSPQAALPARLTDPQPHAGLPPLQVVALLAPPASASLVMPADADLASEKLAATIAPSAKERVLARDGAPAPRIAKLRPPARKPLASEPAAVPPPPAEEEQAQLTGRDHALGRYKMRWGTARLHEDPNSDSALGPTWDFVASAGAR